MLSKANINTRKKWQDSILGFILGAMIIIPVSLHYGYFQPVPYGQVEVKSINRTPENNILYQASFYKSEACDFKRLGVFGKRLGSWEELTWVDPTGSQGDRLVGGHTITLEIQGEPDYSVYEIRTEHSCSGERIDGTFDTFRYDDIKEG